MHRHFADVNLYCPDTPGYYPSALRNGHIVMLHFVKTYWLALLNVHTMKEMLVVRDTLQSLFIWSQLHLAAFGSCK